MQQTQSQKRNATHHGDPTVNTTGAPVRSQEHQSESWSPTSHLHLLLWFQLRLRNSGIIGNSVGFTYWLSLYMVSSTAQLIYPRWCSLFVLYWCSHCRATVRLLAANAASCCAGGWWVLWRSCFSVCKFKAHKRCAVRAINNCKWTTLASIGKDIIEDEDGVSLKLLKVIVKFQTDIYFVTLDC